MKIKMDGEYPDKWVDLCFLNREMACAMIGVPHLPPHDNEINKGFKVVSWTYDSVVAVFFCDGMFKLVKSTDPDHILEFSKKYRERFAAREQYEIDDLYTVCAACGIIHSKHVECPDCAGAAKKFWAWFEKGGVRP